MVAHPHPADEDEAQRVATATRDAMWPKDRAARMLGLQMLQVCAGGATLCMTVREDMLNGHDLCQGGLITALADTAFAYACNAYNEVTVASGFDVNLTSAAKLGDRLTARAVEVAKSGRTGVYDVEVINQHGTPVAAFRGRSYTMKGKPLVEGLPMGKVLEHPPKH